MKVAFFIVAICITFWSGTANATKLLVEYEGTVTSIFNNYPLAVGDNVSGVLIIDLSLAGTDQNPGANVGFFNGCCNNRDFISPETGGPRSPTGSRTVTDSVGIGNFSNEDTITILEGMRFRSGSLTTDQYLSINVAGPSSLLSDTSLLSIAGIMLTNTSHTFRQFSGQFVDSAFTQFGGSNLVASFELTSLRITAVPLPAAAWLFLAAIGGLFGLRKYQRAQAE
ncbi:MAG: VPLPA-CTERM sorting domain-containing protein [Pseudomonadota bacterium]